MSDRDNILKTIDHIVNVFIIIASIFNCFLMSNCIFIAGLLFAIVTLFLHKLNKVKITPDYFPIINGDWVLWEYTVCINTRGVKLKVEELYDEIVKVVNHQNIPLTVFYAQDVCWIVKKADYTKIHTDFRSRAIVQLENSPYKNIHFIAGLDYLGAYWVNLHLMIINYPQHLKKIPKPLRRDRYLNKVNSIGIKIFGIGLLIIINSCQARNIILGSIVSILFLLICLTLLKINYEFKILPACKMYSRAEIIKYESELNRIDSLISIRSEDLPRHFKWDDLRLFHEVARRLVIDITTERLDRHESILTEAKEFNLYTNIIPPNKNDLFDNIR